MVGSIPQNMITGLRELLIAIGTRDSARAITAYQMLNLLLPGADLNLLEKAGDQIFERFWGKTTIEMMNIQHYEVLEFIEEFGNLLYTMPLQIPENFILLGRCLGILSGMCTGLSPDFNPWKSVVPYTRKLVENEVAFKWEFWLEEIGRTLRTLVSLPNRTENLISRIEQGKLEVQSPDIQKQIAMMELTLRRFTRTIVFATFFLGFYLFYFTGEIILAIGLGFAAALSLIWLLIIR